MKTDTALWQAINAYDIDAADIALPFSGRLARDNRWSADFARRVVAEYKRFIYLICVSGNTLTPSEAVDSVWHLHLIYTRDYWDRFCSETLNRAVHHGPTEGGQAEADKYRDCYRQTLALYRQAFGTEPPRDIWPDETLRFAPATTQFIDTRTHVILPRRQVFLCFALAPVMALAGCQVVEQSPVLPWTIFGLLVAALFTLNFAAIKRFGAVNYLISAGLLSFTGAWFFGERGAVMLSGAWGLPIPAETGQAAVASLIASLFTWLYTTQKPHTGSGDSGGCGGGSGCSSGDSGCGGSGCGGGCGGGGD